MRKTNTIQYNQCSMTFLPFLPGMIINVKYIHIKALFLIFGKNFNQIFLTLHLKKKNKLTRWKVNVLSTLLILCGISI